MEDSPQNAPLAGESAPAPPPAPDDLEIVRDLLLGREKAQLSGLRERLDNPVLHARDVSQVLPQAVSLCTTKGDQLARTLAPVVESSLHESVRRNPSAIADAIFPVIGPAIRKSIAETLSRLVQAVNQTLEHSFTLQGLKWRIEAFRTGKSFAEVVLVHTLVYRVEQVYLIHRETGLLLRHIGAPNVLSQDGDMVSGMLTAIQRFMEDCFRVGARETVQTLQVGELNVWLETGPQAVLAAVIRGHAPLEFHQVEQKALERIHMELGPALTMFQGENTPFVAAEPAMETCLLSGKAPAKGRSWHKPLALGVLVLVVVGWWLSAKIREQHRWSACVRQLKSQPGILVTEARKEGGRYHIAGFRDPLATDPAPIFQEYRFDTNQVLCRWEHYQALHPPFVLQRARARLRPPPSVTLRFEDGVLHAEGAGSKTWIEEARRVVETMTGIAKFDTSRLFDESSTLLAASLKEVEGVVLYFDETTRLRAGQEAVLNRLAEQIRRVLQAAARGERTVRIAVLGHTDKKGSPEYNQWLSRQRAEQAVSLLVNKGVPPTLLVPAGLATTQPLRPGMSAEEEHLNRRVSFRIVLENPSEGAP